MNTLYNLLLVAIGGALGAVMRYALSKYIEIKIWSVFPFSTLLVNLLGCLLIGFLCGLVSKHIYLNTQIKLLLVTGLCGGFTTFSTFANDSLILLQQGNALYTIVYTMGSVCLGILLVYVGLYLSAL